MEIHNKTEPDTKSLEDRKYIPFASGVEHIPENEAEDIQAVADMINAIQKAQWNCHRHAFSGTHARTQGLVKGVLKVPDSLPKHLKQSMFANGGEYPVVCRYSSEPGDPGLDVRMNDDDDMRALLTLTRIAYHSLAALR